MACSTRARSVFLYRVDQASQAGKVRDVEARTPTRNQAEDQEADDKRSTEVEHSQIVMVGIRGVLCFSDNARVTFLVELVNVTYACALCFLQPLRPQARLC